MPTLRVTLMAYTPYESLVGYLEIENDGTGDSTMGNYHIRRLNAQREPERQARLTGYPRKLGAWELVAQALMRVSDDPLDASWEGPVPEDDGCA
jgi:hypothetical protein